MDVVSLAPVPVSAVHWRIAEGPWSLAVICKLTFVLSPEMSALGKRQEPIHTADVRTTECADDRIFAASDHVPARGAVDVTAFAPRSVADGASHEVRLCIGTLDKRVSLRGDFAHALSGHASLTPERPERVPEGTDEFVLTEGVDWGVFNTAPLDQRLRDIAPDAELRLSGLHPEHATLTTRLPNVQPQAFIERDGLRRELPMPIDTVWFDGRRGLCCVTFRGQAPLAHRHEPGKIFVAVAGPGRRLSDTGLSELVAQLRGEPRPSVRGKAAHPPSEQGEATLRTRRRPGGTDTSLLGNPEDGVSDEATCENVAFLEDAAPPWLRRAPVATSPALPSARGSLPSLPPSLPSSRRSPDPSAIPAAETQAVPALDKTSSVRTHAPVGTLQSTLVSPDALAAEANLSRSSATLENDPGSAAKIALTSSPWSGAPKEVEGEVAHAARVELPELPREVLRAADVSKLPPRDVVELLWFDADATAKLRRRFSALSAALEFEPLDPQHDLASPEPGRSRAHHTHFGLLTELPVVGLGELRERLRDAVSDSGRFTPPLINVSGELSFPFDAVEQLRTLGAAMAPIVGDDRKLIEALASAENLAASPIAAASVEAVQKFQEHLRRTFRESRRSVSLEQLDEIVARSLLEERQYQRRTLLGCRFIRGLLTTPGTRESVPCYLPDTLSSELPLATSFRARVLAEVHLRLAPYESSRFALRPVTLGRVLDF